MKAAVLSEDPEIRCPSCDSVAYYRYGKTKDGRQRFVCLVCKRQFSLGCLRMEIKNKPVCPECGRPMNLYKREKASIRFRCSNYPECRMYMKRMTGEDE